MSLFKLDKNLDVDDLENVEIPQADPPMIQQEGEQPGFNPEKQGNRK